MKAKESEFGWELVKLNGRCVVREDIVRDGDTPKYQEATFETVLLWHILMELRNIKERGLA